MGNSYEILRELCKVRDDYRAYGKESPISNRGQFIIDFLNANDIEVNINTFDGYLTNIETQFGSSDAGIMFIAHYDIVNLHSDNMNDNSASVAILLNLAKHLKENTPSKRVHIIFTDCEESGGRGARALGNEILAGKFGYIEWVCNLELCGVGSELFIENYTNSLVDKMHSIEPNLGVADVPFNDSVVLRRMEITTICIGLAPLEELQEANKWGYCKHWSYCHKSDDSFERASESDMNRVFEFTLKLIN